jgi:hypothetical protein
LGPAVARAIDQAVDGRDHGPILRNTLGARMDRHAATRRRLGHPCHGPATRTDLIIVDDVGRWCVAEVSTDPETRVRPFALPVGVSGQNCWVVARCGVVSDWALATYWGMGPLPKRPAMGDSDRWAARVGWVVPGVWQLDTMCRYGYAGPDLVGQSQVLGVVPAYDVLFEFGVGPLLPGFNYVLAHPGEPTERSVLLRAAELIAAGESAVVEAGSRPLLCLRRPVRLAGSAVFWNVDRDVGVPGEIEALALAVPRGERLSCLVGLWSPQFGYLHTGQIAVHVEARGYWRATTLLELTGEHNGVSGAVTGSIPASEFLRRQPVPLPGNPWPFGSTAEPHQE